MADTNILHTTEILKAALPYVDARTKTTMDLLVKLYELIYSFRKLRANRLITCGYEDQKADVEAMLNSIRPLCRDKERSLVDQILGVFQAKRMYTMYNTYMSTIKTMQEFGGFPSGGEGEASDNFMNNFAGYDFSSFFGSGSDNGSDENSAAAEAYRAEGSSEECDQAPKQGEAEEEIHTENAADHQGSGDNSQMFDMLKNMIPPEQMSTFENLRMLFNTMSYDDNKKTDSM